jgi:hypothetical protein
MFCGREKIPPPIIEPTTSATNAPSLSCFEFAAMAISRKFVALAGLKYRANRYVMISLKPSPVSCWDD